MLNRLNLMPSINNAAQCLASLIKVISLLLDVALLSYDASFVLRCLLLPSCLSANKEQLTEAA